MNCPVTIFQGVSSLHPELCTIQDDYDWFKEIQTSQSVLLPYRRIITRPFYTTVEIGLATQEENKNDKLAITAVEC